MHKISIAKDFSPFPLGKKPDDGPHSGAQFLEDILYPKLRAAIENREKLEVDLDGALGLTSSFLEEAFTGLIRDKNMNYKDIEKYLVVVTTTPGFDAYVRIVGEYIKEAAEKR